MALSALAIAGVTAAAASVASSAIGAGVSAKVSKDQNETNTQNVKETNEANLQAVRETNAANAEQAELAYERSKPVTQIRNLMQSGMSHAGALNLLQGGGSYSAPTMQTASADAPQVDYSGIIDAIERLEGIPANAMQFSLQGIQAQQVQDELRMKREEHEMNRKALEERLEREREEELRKQYGHDAVKMTDKLSTEIYDLADKYGVNLDEVTSENDLVQKLHLNKSSIWRAAPAAAKQSAVDAARSRAAEFRAQKENVRAERVAEDAHLLSQLNREDLQNRINDYKAEKNARQKEYKLRELQADINQILAEESLSLSDYQHNLEFNKDGSPRFSRKVSERAKRAWNRLADTIGIGVLKDLVRGIVTIAK